MTTAWLPSWMHAAGIALNVSASSGARVAMREHARSAFLRMCPATAPPMPFCRSTLPAHGTITTSCNVSGRCSSAGPGDCGVDPCCNAL